MTKEVIVSVIVEPFWVWSVLLIVFGFAGAVFGIVISWLTCPRYIVVRSYSVQRVKQEVAVSKIVTAKSKRLSPVQRLEELRKRFQPTIEQESADDWQESSRFRKSWHHRKYRGFVRRNYGVTLPRGKVTVYSRCDEYAVRKGNIYYVIPWK